MLFFFTSTVTLGLIATTVVYMTSLSEILGRDKTNSSSLKYGTDVMLSSSELVILHILYFITSYGVNSCHLPLFS